MNVNPYNTTDYENKSNWTLGENKPKTNPIKPNQSRSEAEIPTGELLGILKPGTNFKGKKCCCGKSHRFGPHPNNELRYDSDGLGVRRKQGGSSTTNGRFSLANPDREVIIRPTKNSIGYQSC